MVAKIVPESSLTLGFVVLDRVAVMHPVASTALCGVTFCHDWADGFHHERAWPVARAHPVTAIVLNEPPGVVWTSK